MLWMVQRIFFGELKHDENRNLRDMTGREVLVMLPLVIMMFVMGVITRPFTERKSLSVNNQIVEKVARAAADLPHAPQVDVMRIAENEGKTR